MDTIYDTPPSDSVDTSGGSGFFGNGFDGVLSGLGSLANAAGTYYKDFSNTTAANTVAKQTAAATVARQNTITAYLPMILVGVFVLLGAFIFLRRK